jgi:glycosyltransferase involved in cell wall biosynthesis
MLTFILPSHRDYDALNNVLYRFYSTDCEQARLIVVDSSDKSVALNNVDKISDNRISFLYEANKGIYDAINRGIKAVETEYYLVIGLDDTFHFDKAGVLVETLRLLQYDLAFLGVVKDGRKVAYFNPDRIHDGPQGVFPSHTGGSIIRKDLHDRYGLYDVRFKTVADGLFLCRCLKDGCSAVFLGETFCAIGAGGFSKKKELSAEWESHLVRLVLGTSWLRSSGLFFVRAGKRVLKRVIAIFKGKG